MRPLVPLLLTAVIAVAALVPVALFPAESVPTALGESSFERTSIDASVDGLNIGEHWYGAPADKSDFVGKIVLVELWGS